MIGYHKRKHKRNKEGVGWKNCMLKERGGIHEGRTKKGEHLHLKKLRR